MKVITAIEEYKIKPNDVTCFLAGGITNCDNWQQEVIKELSQFEHTDNLVIFNPRRENFPIHDKSASKKQIEWEFKHLQICDIFSMYFCNSESVQPICFYELGRNLALMKCSVISVEEGFSRTNDVVIQTQLARNLPVYLDATPKSHAKYIYDLYREEILNGKIY